MKDATIIKGKKMVRSTKIDGKKVIVQRTVKVNATDPIATKVNWILDFENCTQDQILEMASRSGVIELQREFRDGTINGNEGEYTFPRPSNRKVKDPVKNAEKALDGLTPEQLAAVIAAHTK